ncbi:MAG: DUF4019 domain-containing protein [Deltaproteobacteria bacterium]|nr:DUF4019 domain-containing protein [Deltaproteobacteria bacterium]MBW2254490.1 DUF4019 domain-containing protein [Deltaproteobacteria bacterium]
MSGIQCFSISLALGVAACGGVEPTQTPPTETVAVPGAEEHATPAVAEHADAEAAAVEAAKRWLALVDEAEYGKSWEEAATLFKGAVDEASWGKQLGPVRGPLGAVKRRELSSAEYATSLPGAPDGEYVVIQFATSFENKAAAVETITPMLDAGTWRVSGYYIK